MYLPAPSYLILRGGRKRALQCLTHDFDGDQPLRDPRHHVRNAEPGAYEYTNTRRSRLYFESVLLSENRFGSTAIGTAS